MAAWRTEFIEPAPRLAVDHAGSGPLVVFLHGIAANHCSTASSPPTSPRRLPKA